MLTYSIIFVHLYVCFVFSEGPKTSRDASSESIKESIERQSTKDTIYMGGASKPPPQQNHPPQKAKTSPYLNNNNKKSKPSPQPSHSHSPSRSTNPRNSPGENAETGSPIPSPRREPTKAHLEKIKQMLLQRAKTQDALKIQRTKSQVAKVSEIPVEKEMEKREKDLYKLEDAMHIYFQDYLKAKGKSVLEPRHTTGKAEGQPDSPRKKNVYTDPNRNIPPWHRKEYTLSKREEKQYNHISNIYGKETKDAKRKREENFYKKCLELQVEAWRRLHEEYAALKRREATKREKQAEQLDSKN